MRILTVTRKCSLCGKQGTLLYKGRYKDCNKLLIIAPPFPSTLAPLLSLCKYYTTVSCSSYREPPYIYCTNNTVTLSRVPSHYLKLPQDNAVSPVITPQQLITLSNKTLTSSTLTKSTLSNSNNYKKRLTNNSSTLLFSSLNTSSLPHDHSSLHSADRPTPAQLSFVLFKLREELPQFFSGYHSYQSLYRNDVQFENKLFGVSLNVRGRSNYRMCLSSLRRLLCTINSNVTLQLLKITKNVDTGQIEARWRITGTPRYYQPWSVTRVIVDGFSTFTIDETGKIKLHVMDKVMPVPKSRFWVQSFFIRLRGLILKPLPTATNTTTS